MKKKILGFLAILGLLTPLNGFSIQAAQANLLETESLELEWVEVDPVLETDPVMMAPRCMDSGLIWRVTNGTPLFWNSTGDASRGHLPAGTFVTGTTPAANFTVVIGTRRFVNSIHGTGWVNTGYIVNVC